MKKNFDLKYILDKLVEKPNKCKLCNYTSISIVVNNTLNNPYIRKYSNSQCRKIIYLRENTFLNEFPRTPASIILYVLKLWLIDDKNAIDIYIDM